MLSEPEQALQMHRLLLQLLLLVWFTLRRVARWSKGGQTKVCPGEQLTLLRLWGLAQQLLQLQLLRRVVYYGLSFDPLA